MLFPTRPCLGRFLLLLLLLLLLHRSPPPPSPVLLFLFNCLDTLKTSLTPVRASISSGWGQPYLKHIIMPEPKSRLNKRGRKSCMMRGYMTLHSTRGILFGYTRQWHTQQGHSRKLNHPWSGPFWVNGFQMSHIEYSSYGTGRRKWSTLTGWNDEADGRQARLHLCLHFGDACILTVQCIPLSSAIFRT